MIVPPRELIGNAAEYLVCYDLAKKGYRAALSPYPKSPYDVICEVNSEFLRVQVKGTSKARTRAHSSNLYYQFNVPRIAPKSFDILALVATDLETIHYLDYSMFNKHKSSIMVPVKEMSKNKDEMLLNCMKTFE